MPILAISSLTKWGRGGPPVFYASAIVGLLCGGMVVYTFLLPVWQPGVSVRSALSMGLILTILVLTSALTCWSSLHKGRWGGLGVALGVFCLVSIFLPFLFVGSFFLTTPFAIMTITCAVLNIRESGRSVRPVS